MFYLARATTADPTGALARRRGMKHLFSLLLMFGCGLGHDLRPALEGSALQPPAGEDAGDAGPEPARYLALGDSYTIGESVAEAERWPVQLAARLGTAAPQIIARTGWTVAELDRGIDRVAPEGPYGLVTLLIGVNDQFRGGDAQGYRPALRAMLQRAVGLAGGAPCRVVALSIPDYGNTPFGRPRGASIGAAIDAFNTVGAEEAEAAGVAWVSVTEISRGPDPGLVARDGLHPSGAQYTRWAEAAVAPARAALACAGP